MPMPLPRRTARTASQESMPAPRRQQRARCALRTRIRMPPGPRHVTPACQIPPHLWGARRAARACAMLAWLGRLRQTCVCLVRQARTTTCQERRSASIAWRGSTPVRRGQQRAWSAHHGRRHFIAPRFVVVSKAFLLMTIVDNAICRKHE